jgi:hypothetical protein
VLVIKWAPLRLVIVAKVLVLACRCSGLVSTVKSHLTARLNCAHTLTKINFST